jgi:hypothetical protein
MPKCLTPNWANKGSHNCFLRSSLLAEHPNEYLCVFGLVLSSVTIRWIVVRLTGKRVSWYALQLLQLPPLVLLANEMLGAPVNETYLLHAMLMYLMVSFGVYWFGHVRQIARHLGIPVWRLPKRARD